MHVGGGREGGGGVYGYILDVRKYGATEKIKHNRSTRINCCMREKLSLLICDIGRVARDFSGAKIPLFTVFKRTNKKTTKNDKDPKDTEVRSENDRQNLT